jgi:hypothetical protein
MDDGGRDDENPEVNPALPLVVGVVAVLALAGALAYIFLSGHSGRSGDSRPAAASEAGRVRLTTPAGIVWTRRFIQLQARATGGAHDVRLEFRKTKFSEWSPIPAQRLSTQRAGVSLPLRTDARGTTALVRWDMPATTARDAGEAPENAIGDHDAAVWVRAVATSADGDLLASAPVVAALVRRGPPYPDARAPGVHLGIVFSGGKPLHVTWSRANNWYRLPDESIVAVPLAGYAVDVVDRDALSAGDPLPPARITTTTESRSYDVPIPPPSEREHVVVIRAIDVVGNVGDWEVRVEFRSQSLVLAAPEHYQDFRGDEPVPLIALNASPRPVCFEYRPEYLPEGSHVPFVPIPPGEVTRASGKPIGTWPVEIAPNGSRFLWHGLRHARKHRGRLVQIRVVRTTAKRGCDGAVAASIVKTITWRR